jgi:8-oxo-dGTP pyrophosphatase MutT (NUDIX family)
MPSSSRSDATVRSAGALVVRDGRVLLVHRPKHDDWSFPKGKVEPGESDEECAVREVEEETGLRARLAGPLGETRYALGDGSPKTVAYFRALADGEPVAGDGVDAVRWATVEEALAQLTWQRDRELLAAVAASL